jgi:hypothetical protein
MKANRSLQQPWFHWTMVGLSGLLVLGAYVDSWAHSHLLATRETFFTPWHALLYTSLALTTAFLVLCAAWTGARVRDWGRALPDGYALSLLGCIAFGVGGVLDMAWHLVFGIEVGFQALISPTHLILMGSGALIVSGPLRAAWRSQAVRATWPAVISAALLVSLFTFFGQFDHPFTSQWSASPAGPVPPEAAEELGVLGVIIQTAGLMVVVVALVKRFQLPLGSLTVVIGLSSTLVTLVHANDPILLIGLLTGVFGDVLLVVLRPSTERIIQLRILAVTLPVFMYALYFRAIQSYDGIWWPVHLWTGSIALAGLTGLVVSLIAVRAPREVADGVIEPAHEGRQRGFEARM